MKTKWAILATCVLAFAGLGMKAGAATGLIMPMYGNTGSQFSQVYAAALKVPVIAILNPDDGAGTRKDNYIAGQVNALKSRGVTVVGYISTQYGGRDEGEVDTESDRYKSWYGVHGLFLDEVSDSTAKLNYYKSIRSYAQGIGIGYIVLNPGTSIPSSYLQAGTVIVDYEHSNGQIYFPTAGVGSWVRSNPGRSAGIVYGAGAGSMQTMVDAALAKGYAWIYVTDRNEPDPFGVSASYFAAEVDYLAGLNNPGPTVPGATSDFRILASEVAPAVPGGPPYMMKITVRTVPGRSYELQCSPTMAPGSWVTAGWHGNSAILLRGVVNTTDQYWEAGVLPGPKCFFRVVDITP